MNVEKINISARPKRILVAPLDWGLGHATRCIPLIKFLKDTGVEVVIAASGAGCFLLKEEFPELEVLTIPGYNIRYAKQKKVLIIKLLFQLPKIRTVMHNEQEWLLSNSEKYRFDGVISDNRFGLYSPDLPSVYITHQLNIEAGNALLNHIARRMHLHIMARFQQCWVPDLKEAPGLAGELSHPGKTPPIPIKYIGILSRIKKQAQGKTDTLLILLSGPEPQRTIFEELLLSQISEYRGPVLMIRGLPGDQPKLKTQEQRLTVKNHANAEELSSLMQSAGTIIARCGYSTVMDLYGINQQAILVPTPGQTEQEYLAKHLKKKAIFYTTSQKNFDLADEIRQLRSFKLQAHTHSREFDQNVITEWLASVPLR